MTTALPTTPPTPPPTSAPSEPALMSGLLYTFLTLLLNLAAYYGLTISTPVRFWVMVGMSMLGILASALRIRGQVFSPASWARLQQDLASTNAALQAAQAVIASHKTSVEVVESTILSALQQVVAQQGAAASLSDPGAVMGAPAMAALPEPVQPPQQPSWSSVQQGWSSAPQGMVSGTSRMVSPYADPAGDRRRG